VALEARPVVTEALLLGADDANAPPADVRGVGAAEPSCVAGVPGTMVFWVAVTAARGAEPRNPVPSCSSCVV
jgi:hypothetical protein